MTELSKRIKELRHNADLTQDEFGKIFGIVKSTVSLYESGKSTPNDELKLKICKYFNVSADYLLGISVQDTAAGSVSTLSPEEQDVIDAYRKADEGIKISVCKLLDVKKEEAQIKDA